MKKHTLYKCVKTLLFGAALGMSASCVSAADDGSSQKESGKKSAPKTMGGMPLVFSESFEEGNERWQLTDENAWSRHLDGDTKNHVFGLTQRKSDYQPKVRSPHNIALIKDLELTDFVMTFRVRSTKDTGGHRDCCAFFCHQDAENFYYVHLGARPDPHSGQIMIVDSAPRLALTENEKEVPWDDKWHKVKIVRNGSKGTIRVFFDNMKKPHLKTTDKTFGKGRLGIGSFDDMNDFDDIKVWGK